MRSSSFKRLGNDGVSVAEVVRQSVDLFLGQSGQWTKRSQVHEISRCQADTVSHDRTSLLLMMTACTNAFAIQRLSRYLSPVQVHADSGRIVVS